MTSRRPRRFALLTALLCILGLRVERAESDGPGGAESRERAVRKAIAVGQALLRTSQKADGSWSVPRGAAYAASASALCALAIVDDPTSAEPVERTIRQLQTRDLRDTYAVALRALLFRRRLSMPARPTPTQCAELAPVLRADERMLVEYQSSSKAGGDGLWGYPSPPRNILTTAFAAWALSARATSEVPTVDWEALGRGVMRLQPTAPESSAPAAGFGYALENQTVREATNGWRTAAGLFVLRLSMLRSTGAAEDLRARAAQCERRAAEWLAQSFHPNLHPQGQGSISYYGNLIFLDLWRDLARDDAWRHPRWREDCERVVLQRQSGKGGWEGDDPIATALAVLFLRGVPSLLRSATEADPVVTRPGADPRR